MAYSLKRLAEAVEPKLVGLFTDAEIIYYDNSIIEFTALVNGEWLEGEIKIDYISDLEVYIRYKGNGHFSYVSDIHWCDLEEVLGV